MAAGRNYLEIKMALKVHITRIDTNASFMKHAKPAATMSHQQITYAAQNNAKTISTLIHVPEDRNIRKFPVRIFELEPAE
jgi:hypothetical protein